MNTRISRLRKNSLEAINTLSAERALLLTEYYSQGGVDKLPIPVQRAESFRYILNHKHICIQENELIVGERGPKPKATPTYPEISLHSLEDLDVLNNRPKVSFKVDEATRKSYEDIVIPFWKGKSQREHLFANMTDEWLTAYEAGVFTEFQEQRAPGHTAGGVKLFKMGMSDYIRQIDQKLTQSIDSAQKIELEGMKIAAQAMIEYAQRNVAELQKQLLECIDIQRKKELEEMISVCKNVPVHAPQTFHEALQHYWFIHLGVITELNPWDSFNPGRLDRHLFPFYKKEIAEGTLTKEKAIELLQAFWIKFNNHPAPPKVGVTALESNTYTDFALINLGGVNEDGSDAVNELTYIILDVIEEMRLLQPS